MKTITKALGGLVAAIALALPAQADPLTLAELFAGQSITAGDKVFDNWTNLTDPGFFSSDPTRTFNPGNITVTSLGDGGDDPGPGLRFAVLDGELNIGGDGGYAFIDLAFGFRVTPAPGKAIKDVSMDGVNGFLQFSPNATGAGPLDAGFYIKEYVDSMGYVDLSFPNPDLASIDVEFSYLEAAGETSKLKDGATFAPSNSIYVTKNVLVWASAQTDAAGVWNFEQRFSQQSVPEPGSLALAALALAGLGAAARRRRIGGG